MTIYEQWRWAMAGVDAKKAISQTRAAQLVGVKLRTWQSWEWGEYEPPPYLPLADSSR